MRSEFMNEGMHGLSISRLTHDRLIPCCLYMLSRKLGLLVLTDYSDRRNQSLNFTWYKPREELVSERVREGGREVQAKIVKGILVELV